MERNSKEKLENESSKSTVSSAPNSSPPTPNPLKDLIEDVLAPNQRNVDENGNCDVCKQNIQIEDANRLWMIDKILSCSEEMSVCPAEHYVMRGRGTKDDEFLIVKVKMPQGNVDGEQDEKIPKMEAICKICFCTFQEDNVLKTKCKCRFTLIHEECVEKLPHHKGNYKCDVCEQDVQSIPVTLSKAQLSSTTPKSIWNKIAGFF